MKLNLKLFIAGAAALLGSTAALAQQAPQAQTEDAAPQQHQFRHHRRHGFMGPKMVEQLGLSSAQQTQLASLKTNLKAEIQPVRAVIQSKHAELKALWSAPNKDRNAIIAKAVEIDQQKSVIRTALVDFRIAFNNLLTPAQQAQLAQMRANHHQRG
jgi:Spy/CpxP family protein refolding chaperone